MKTGNENEANLISIGTSRGANAESALGFIL
jgi:hypothetical protein